MENKDVKQLNKNIYECEKRLNAKMKELEKKQELLDARTEDLWNRIASDDFNGGLAEKEKKYLEFGKFIGATEFFIELDAEGTRILNFYKNDKKSNKLDRIAIIEIPSDCFVDMEERVETLSSYLKPTMAMAL